MTEARYAAMWAAAFALTVALEAPIVAWWLRRRGAPLGRAIAAACFAQLATHPWVWFVFPALGWQRRTSLAASELFAWWIEAALYALVTPGLRWRAVVVSLVANGVSYGVGALLW